MISTLSAKFYQTNTIKCGETNNLPAFSNIMARNKKRSFWQQIKHDVRHDWPWNKKKVEIVRTTYYEPNIRNVSKDKLLPPPIPITNSLSIPNDTELPVVSGNAQVIVIPNGDKQIVIINNQAAPPNINVNANANAHANAKSDSDGCLGLLCWLIIIFFVIIPGCAALAAL